MRQSSVNRAEVLRRRSARVAFPRRAFVTVTTTRTHQMAVVFLEQSPDTQQVSDTHQVRPELFHHRFGLWTRVKVKLPAKDSREDIELLMGDIVRRRSWC
jgi:hypothetical protein